MRDFANNGEVRGGEVSGLDSVVREIAESRREMYAVRVSVEKIATETTLRNETLEKRVDGLEKKVDMVLDLLRGRDGLQLRAHDVESRLARLEAASAATVKGKWAVITAAVGGVLGVLAAAVAVLRR